MTNSDDSTTPDQQAAGHQAAGKRRWPGPDELRAIASHLDAIERPAEELYTVLTPSGMLGYLDYGPEVGEFMADLNRLGFVHPYDWPSWAQAGMALQEDPERLAEADLTDLVKLLTMHVRAERFNDGHWAQALRRGWFAGILRRLAAIEALASSDATAAAPLLADRERLAAG